MDIMSACDPSYGALHKPNDNGALEGIYSMSSFATDCLSIK